MKDPFSTTSLPKPAARGDSESRRKNRKKGEDGKAPQGTPA